MINELQQVLVIAHRAQLNHWDSAHGKNRHQMKEAHGELIGVLGRRVGISRRAVESHRIRLFPQRPKRMRLVFD